MKGNQQEKELISIGIVYRYDYAMVSCYGKNFKEPIIVTDSYLSKKIPTCICVDRIPIDELNSLEDEDNENDENDNIENTENEKEEKKEKIEYETIILYGNEAKNSHEGKIFWGITPTNEKYFSTNTGNHLEEDELFTPEEVTYQVINYLIKLVKQRFMDIEIGNVCISLSHEYFLNKKQKFLEICHKIGLKKENVEIIESINLNILEHYQISNSQKNFLNQHDIILAVELNTKSFDCYCCEVIGNDINDIHNYIQILSKSYNESIYERRFDFIIGDIVMDKINDALVSIRHLPIDFNQYFSIPQSTENELSEDEKEEKLSLINYFWNEVEKLKKALWKDAEIAFMPFSFVNDTSQINNNKRVVIQYDDIERIIVKEKIFEKIETQIKETIKQSGCSISKIKQCIFIGEVVSSSILKQRILRILNKDILNRRQNIKFETFETEAASKRAYQSRNQSQTIAKILPMTICYRIGITNYKELFKKGITLPTQQTIEINVNENELSEYLFEIGKQIGESTQKIRLLKNAFIPNIKQKEKVQLKLSINKYGLVELSEIDNQIIKIGNIGLYNKEHTNLTDEKVSIENTRTVNLQKKSCGIQLRDNYSIPFYFDYKTGKINSLLNENGHINNEISMTKYQYQINYKLGSKNDTYIKITEVNKLLENDKLMEEKGITIGTNSKNEQTLTFTKSKITTTIKQLMMTYMNEMKKMYETKVKQDIGNIVISIPLHFDEKDIRFLTNYFLIEGISNIEYIYESYAALIWFNEMKITFIGKGTTVRVINIQESYIEIDVIEITDMFDDMIIKIKRKTKFETQWKIQQEIIDILKKYIEEDKTPVDRVITLGDISLTQTIDSFVKKSFRESSIHHLENDVIGKGACLRSIEIEELFESGIEIEPDVKFLN